MSERWANFIQEGAIILFIYFAFRSASYLVGWEPFLFGWFGGVVGAGVYEIRRHR